MKNLRDNFKGLAAICIAAGPSLDSVISDLKRLPRNALLIACDSAVNALVEEGLRPHFVVTTDVFETNIQKLKPHFEALKDTIFIFGIESNPNNIRLFLGTRRIAVSAHNKLLIDWLNPALDLLCQYPAMSSVSHMALFTALAMGAEPIVLVGMDLAYRQGKSHSYHSVFFHTLDSKNIVETLGTDGTMVPSSAQFVADKLLIGNVVKKEKKQIINTTLKGAHIEGTEIKSLDETIELLKNRVQINAIERLDTVNWQKVADEEKAIRIVSSMAKKFENFKSMCAVERRKAKERKIEIQNLENRNQRANLLENVRIEFEEFKKDNLVYLNLINDTILSETSEILKRRESISFPSDEVDSNNFIKQLDIIADYYDAFEKGIEFQVGKLQSFCSLQEEVIGTGDGSDGCQNFERTVQRTNCYEKHGELWQVRREYEKCMREEKETLAPYIHLANAYIKEKLWRPALVLTEKATTLFSDTPALLQLKKEITDGIDALFDEIKNEWMQGNIDSTRKLMNQYLIIRPEDPQINELKTVIRELDEEFSRDWSKGEDKKKQEQKVDDRLEKACKHIKDLRFEQGIGILEGIVEDFPTSRRQLREQIGDIRTVQKDYESARWNYSEALKHQPGNRELQEKLNFAASRL